MQIDKRKEEKKKKRFYLTKLIFNWDKESQFLVNSFVVNTFILLFVINKILPKIRTKFLMGLVIFCLFIYIVSYIGMIFNEYMFKDKEKEKTK